MIVDCAISSINDTVTVLVNELDVTRTIGETSSLESLLGCYACSVTAIGIKIRTCEVTVGLKSPDFTPLLAAITGIDEVCIIVPLSNDSLVIRKVRYSVNIDITEIMSPVNCKFPTT